MKRSNECELAAAPEVQLAGVPLLQRDGACAFGRFLMQHGWSVLPLGSTEAKTLARAGEDLGRLLSEHRRHEDLASAAVASASDEPDAAAPATAEEEVMEEEDTTSASALARVLGGAPSASRTRRGSTSTWIRLAATSQPRGPQGTHRRPCRLRSWERVLGVSTAAAAICSQGASEYSRSGYALAHRRSTVQIITMRLSCEWQSLCRF